ncbi:MAG: biotin--[acetyl-CoA-carboxylase] ligase [Desulfobacula sp.]|jgi:BirA family biotin operon repressor/biotin-[acetyl-CoA-carboxylase] ligase
MVNEETNIKNEILKILFSAKGETVSGVMLSENLCVSRVAIWKHISALKENGFDIESRPRGYALLNPDDLLLPFCFGPEFENRIFHFQELESTMDQAKSLAKSHAPHLSLVIAENQTTGRGRLNRKWVSSRGGLWFTLILKPCIPPVLSYIYNFAASLCLSKTLNCLFDLDVKVKWPNDLLLNGKKLAGLLSEMETKGDMAEFVNIGIGLNVNNEPGKYEPKAISIRDVLNRVVSRQLILKTFLIDFQDQVKTIDYVNIISLWKKQTSTIGSQVRIETFGEIFEGLAVDVDETGALIIQDKTGEAKKIIYGDCFHT